MTRPEPRWVPRLVLEAVHLDQVREHGGLLGLRDENVLESAMSRARQRWTYEPEADLARLAADYAFGICRNHPFRDGNKRMGFLAAVIFLGLNGQWLAADEPDVVSIMRGVAAGDVDEDELAAWIRTRMTPRG